MIDLNQHFVIRLVAAGIIGMIFLPLCEFVIGMSYRLQKKQVPWEYVRFERDSIRRVSAFTPHYFTAWFVIAVLHYIIIDFLVY